MTLFHLGLTALTLATFLSFAWAILKFFRRPDGIQPGMRAISVLGNLGGFGYLILPFVTRPATPGEQGAGLGLYLLALALFWWTVAANRSKPLSLAYSHDLPEHLVTHGPYAWIRHPFYASYTLAWLAGPVATGAWWLFPFVTLMIGLYWRAATQEEAKFLASPFTEAYQRYRARTGMLIPTLSLWRSHADPMAEQVDNRS